MIVDELVRELSGPLCRCGARKVRGQTFCKPCYFALPPPLRVALYRGIGNGYEEAYASAVGTLESVGRRMMSDDVGAEGED